MDAGAVANDHQVARLLFMIGRYLPAKLIALIAIGLGGQMVNPAAWPA